VKIPFKTCVPPLLAQGESPQETLKEQILKKSQREAEPLLYNNKPPFPLLRGRGIKGDRVTK